MTEPQMGQQATTPPAMTGAGTGAAADPPALSEAIRQRLLRPAAAVALADLPARWFHYLVTVRCRRPPGLRGGPRLAGQVRGALGQALRDLADRDSGAAAALAVLFGPGVRLTGRLEIPRPGVLAVREDGAYLRLTLTLIGFATDLLEPVAEGLRRGLARGLGPGPAIRPAPGDWHAEAVERVAVPARARLALVEFETPYASRSGRWLIGGSGNLMARLAQRVSLMARWQDCRAEADWGALIDGARHLRFHDDDLRPARWDRRSARQDGRRIPMAGMVGRLLLEGDLTPYLPLLAIGETCHVGGRASLGLGRYRLRVMA